MQLQNKKSIANEINTDIKKGVYDLFPLEKSRMEHIAHKLVLACYCPTTKLSSGEIKTLEANDYLRE